MRAVRYPHLTATVKENNRTNKGDRQECLSYYVIKRFYHSLLYLFAFSLAYNTSGSSQTPHFNQDQAFAYLEKQCSFGPRNPGSEGAKSCLKWFETTLNDFGAEVFLQRFEAEEALTGKKQRLTNVLALLKGDNDPPLMLCAHWDTRAHADRDPNPENQKEPILGANDGASGVAVLLEIARIAAEYAPPRSLLIALWDGEDMGRAGEPEEFALGSKYWSEHQIPTLVEQAILLDLIGDADLEIPIEPFSDLYSPGLRERLWEIADRLELSAFTERAGSPVFDDHIRLQRVGIQAVNIVDFEYDYWHTVEDTPDNCSPESLGQVGRLIIGFIYGLD